MNWLFVGFVVFVVLGVAWTVRRDGGLPSATRQGPVPGYSITPGSALAADESLPLKRGADWQPLTIETFHSERRARVVLRLELLGELSEQAVRDFAEACAARVGERSRASVVFLEILAGGQPRAWYLWSADGRGWSGGERVASLFMDAKASGAA